MPQEIKLAPDEAREIAKQYRQEADAVNQVIGNMDTLLQRLSQAFVGNAYNEYDARYQELKPGFVKAEELIREIAAALDSSVNAIEELDRRIASQYKA